MSARHDILEEAAVVLDAKAALYKAYADRARDNGDGAHAIEMAGHYATVWDCARAVRALKEKP